MNRQIERHQDADAVSIVVDVDYHALDGLKFEAAEALTRFRPETLGQAARLAGITPADIGVLQMHLARSGALPRLAADSAETRT